MHYFLSKAIPCTWNDDRDFTKSWPLWQHFTTFVTFDLV